MYGNYLNNGLAQGITFQTDSHNAEFERATVYSNFIPKEGSNTFRGSFFGRWAGESWQSDNLSDEQKAQGLSTGEPHRADLGHQPQCRRAHRPRPSLGLRRVPALGHLQHGCQLVQRRGFLRHLLPSDDGTEPEPGLASERRRTLYSAGQSKEQDQRLHRLAIHLLRQLLRPDILDSHQRVPWSKNIPQYIVPRELELAGDQQAAARSGRHDYAAGLPWLSAAWCVRDAVRDARTRRPPLDTPTTWGSSPTSYGYNRSDQMNFRGFGLLRDRLALDQGWVHAHALVALQHAGAQQLRHAPESVARSRSR